MLLAAREFMDRFTNWYNHEHRPTGISLHTPADDHFGLAPGKAADRRSVLVAAREQHPHRLSTTAVPKILDLPDSWINRPAAESKSAEDSETAAA